MKSQKEKQVRELIETIKLHQLILQMEAQLEEYSKSRDRANFVIASEITQVKWEMEGLKSLLYQEIFNNNAWEDIDGYT